MVYLAFIGGFLSGTIIGFVIAGLFSSQKIEDAFQIGYNRGKSTTMNVIK